MRAAALETPAPPRTVDGVPVKVGVTVWRASAAGVRTCKLARHHVGLWVTVQAPEKLDHLDRLRIR